MGLVFLFFFFCSLPPVPSLEVHHIISVQLFFFIMIHLFPITYQRMWPPGFTFQRWNTCPNMVRFQKRRSVFCQTSSLSLQNMGKYFLSHSSRACHVYETITLTHLLYPDSLLFRGGKIMVTSLSHVAYNMSGMLVPHVYSFILHQILFCSSIFLYILCVISADLLTSLTYKLVYL